MGINTFGEFAAVTNYREVPLDLKKPKSRGALPLGFLADPRKDAISYLEEIMASGDDYAPFNLLLGNFRELYYGSNRTGGITKVQDGIHGLSNHLLNTPWPKVERGKALLKQWLDEKEPEISELLGLMEDRELAQEAQLPDTGIDKLHEKLLSGMFIQMDNYGTCLTTALLIDQKGNLMVAERSHYPQEKEPMDQFIALKNYLPS
jgi:uncharacterized protein with NRDE domain